MKDYFKTQLIIRNIDGKEDHVREKEFWKEYLLHSFREAEEEYFKNSELIESGKLTANLPDLTEKEVDIASRLIFVKVGEEKNEEFVIRISSQPEPINWSIIQTALEIDKIALDRELEAGHVRHSIPVEEANFFRTEFTEITPEKCKVIETREFTVSCYGRFKEAFLEAMYVHSTSLNHRAAYYPEDGKDLHIASYLVEQQETQEIKTLIAENDEEYELSPAKVRELNEKYTMQQVIWSRLKVEPIYGRNSTGACRR